MMMDDDENQFWKKKRKKKARKKIISFSPNGPRQIKIQVGAIQTVPITSLNSPYNPIFGNLQILLFLYN